MGHMQCVMGRIFTKRGGYQENPYFGEKKTGL